MTIRTAVLSIFCLFILLPTSYATAENDMIVADQSLPLGPRINSLDTSMNGALSLAPSPEFSGQAVFRDVPSVSKRYSFGGQSFSPYLGAGFGSGYASELDRSLNSGNSTMRTDPGLRGQFGQSMVPNEFQMGVRIPF